MPVYNDLKDLKDKIQSAGNEIEILHEKGLPLNNTPIPEEIQIKKDLPDETTEEMLNDIMDDFDQGMTIDDESKGDEPEELNSLDDIEDPSSDLENTNIDVNEQSEEGLASQELDALLGDTGEAIPEEGLDELADIGNEEPAEQGSDELGDLGDMDQPQEDQGLEGLADLGDMTQTDDQTSNQELDALLGDAGEAIPEEGLDELADIGNEEPAEQGLDELGDLGGIEQPQDDQGLDGLADLGDMTQTDDQTSNQELDALLDGAGEPEQGLDELADIGGIEQPQDDQGLDGLADLGNMDQSQDDQGLDGLADLGDMAQTDDQTSNQELDALLDGAGEPEQGLDELADIGGIEQPQDDQGLDGLADLGDMTQTEDQTSNQELNELLGDSTEPEAKSSSNEVDDVLEQLGKEAESYSDLQELDNLLGDDDTPSPPPMEESGPGEIDAPITNDSEENFDALDTNPLEGLNDLDGISDITTEGLDTDSEIPSQQYDEQLSSDDAFGDETLDIDSLGSFESTEEPDSQFSEPELPSEAPSKISETPAGAVPEEISQEEIENNEDVDLVFTEEERKKIVIALTTLPKEAEIKIAKAIISNKYANNQLKPMMDALIKKESPFTILKYYEKITGDKSLAHIDAVKHTGEEFEELQKSFSYVFQKNVLPILSIITSAAVVFLIIIFLTIRVINPTLQATKYYNLGKKNIEKKIFWEVENNFEKAFNLQPRYKEVLEYARKYTKSKRYLEAEKKYQIASKMKPDNPELALEFSDFFRKIKDYERAENRYKTLIKIDDKNIGAVLGLAKTYLDWSEEVNEKIEDAKETYLDALSLDGKNKEAVFGRLKIFIREKNKSEIIKHYNYIKAKMPKKIDSSVYAELAGYFLDTGEVNKVKEVLEKAHEHRKRGEILPEIDYQYARYKKQLKISNEEKKHLLTALNGFEALKKSDLETYESQKYQRMLAHVYNDLGENYYNSSKANIDAEKYFLQSIHTDPYFGRPYYNLANFALKYKPNGYLEAKNNYMEAEQKGFSNDTLNFNLGWLYYKENDYYDSYKRTASLLEKHPDNSNLKFFIGTTFYKLKKYDLAESMLLETYMHFNRLTEQYRSLDPDIEEEAMILEMTKKVSNNLGAVYQKKFDQTRDSKYLIKATKYYSDSINSFDKLARESSGNNEDYMKYKKENGNINLRMVLYPDAGKDEPIIYEDFPLDFMITM